MSAWKTLRCCAFTDPMAWIYPRATAKWCLFCSMGIMMLSVAAVMELQILIFGSLQKATSVHVLRRSQASMKRQIMNIMYCGICDLVFSQKSALWTHHSNSKISRNTGICRSSFGRIIHDLFRATHSGKNNVPNRLLMYYQVV